VASAGDFRRLALALEGTTEAPHFDRAAFRVARIYATLAADGTSANLKLLADEQALKCEMHPEFFAAVSGKWGEHGWTTVHLGAVPRAVLADALRMAWLHAEPAPRKGKR
jgi:YjbR